MIRYTLDTNTCIHIIKDRPEPICRKLSRLAVGEVAISSIVAAELWYGVACSEKKKQNEVASEISKSMWKSWHGQVKRDLSMAGFEQS